MWFLGRTTKTLHVVQYSLPIYCNAHNSFGHMVSLSDKINGKHVTCTESGYETVGCKRSTSIVYLPSPDEKLGGPVKEVSFCVYAYLHSISNQQLCSNQYPAKWCAEMIPRAHRIAKMLIVYYGIPVLSRLGIQACFSDYAGAIVV